MFRVIIALCILLIGLTLASVVMGHALPEKSDLTYVSHLNGNLDIYTMDIERRLSYNLTHNRAHDVWPSWSPDGSQIAFLSARNNDPSRLNLYVMNAYGGDVRQVAAPMLVSGQPAWSPDGRWLAFRALPSGGSKIYVVDTFTMDSFNLIETGGADSAPIWSPDGHWVAFLSYRDANPRIYVASPACIATAEGCRHNDPRLLNHSVMDWPPSWSPDGQHLAFTSLSNGGPEIYTVEVRCTSTPADCVDNDVRRTQNTVNDQWPAWSPDSEHLAFVSAQEGWPQIFLLHRATGDIRRLTNHPTSDRTPAWSPNGALIAFVSEQAGQADLYVTDVQTGSIQQLTNRGVAKLPPLWRP